MIDNDLRRRLRKRKQNSKRPGKLSEAQIHSLLERYANGESAIHLAREHRVSEAAVRYHVAKALA